MTVEFLKYLSINARIVSVLTHLLYHVMPANEWGTTIHNLVRLLRCENNKQALIVRADMRAYVHGYVQEGMETVEWEEDCYAAIALFYWATWVWSSFFVGECGIHRDAVQKFSYNAFFLEKIKIKFIANLLPAHQERVVSLVQKHIKTYLSRNPFWKLNGR